MHRATLGFVPTNCGFELFDAGVCCFHTAAKLRSLFWGISGSGISYGIFCNRCSNLHLFNAYFRILDVLVECGEVVIRCINQFQHFAALGKVNACAGYSRQAGCSGLKRFALRLISRHNRILFHTSWNNDFLYGLHRSFKRIFAFGFLTSQRLLCTAQLFLRAGNIAFDLRKLGVDVACFSCNVAFNPQCSSQFLLGLLEFFLVLAATFLRCGGFFQRQPGV